jgi:hypothetical protein
MEGVEGPPPWLWGREHDIMRKGDQNNEMSNLQSTNGEEVYIQDRPQRTPSKKILLEML